MTMTKVMLAGLATFALAGPVQAQTAAQSFGYSAPSGMFSEGTTKWNNYRFMFEDAERTAKLRTGDGLTTGSVQETTTNTETYRRPGETGLRSGRRR